MHMPPAPTPRIRAHCRLRSDKACPALLLISFGRAGSFLILLEQLQDPKQEFAKYLT